MYSTILFGTVLYCTLWYCNVQYCTFTKNSQNHFNVTINQLEEGEGLEQIVIRSGCLSRCQGCQDLKVLGFKVTRVTRVPGLKVTRVTRVTRLKGLLRDRVFSRTHLRSSLTPEEGPSCIGYWLFF